MDKSVKGHPGIGEKTFRLIFSNFKYASNFYNEYRMVQKEAGLVS